MRGAELFALLFASAGVQEGDAVPRLPYEGTETVATVTARTDVTCILRSWRLKGVMVCPSPSGGVNVCLRVENAWPSGILEVVRQPWRSHLAELGGVLEPLGKTDLLLSGSSSHTEVAGAGSATQFAEARVITYVPPMPAIEALGIPIAKPSSMGPMVAYLSELDRLAWRSPAVDELVAPVQSRLGRLRACGRAAPVGLPDPVGCAGRWGSWFPRTGFVVHPSRVMASHLQALRGGRVAALPAGRIALSPHPFEPRTGHYVQLVTPSPRACLAIGSPLTLPVERGNGSRYGAHLFIQFGVFESCNGCLPVHLVGPRSPVR